MYKREDITPTRIATSKIAYQCSLQYLHPLVECIIKRKIASFILYIDKVGGAVLVSLPGPDCALAGTTVASSMHAAAAYKSIRIVAEYHVPQGKNRPARKSSLSFPNRLRCPTPTFSAIFNTRYAPSMVN